MNNMLALPKKIILTLATSIYLPVSSLASPALSLAADSGGTWYNQSLLKIDTNE